MNYYSENSLLRRLLPYIFFLLLAFVSITHTPAQNHRDNTERWFVITGKAYGFKDSVLLYLDNAETGKKCDSAYIFEESFELKGTYPENMNAMKMIIRTKDYTDYKFFWAEGKTIRFTGRKGGFDHSTIEGSPADDLEKLYSRQVDKYWEKVKKLGDELKNKTANDSLLLQDSIRQLEQKIIKVITADFIINHPYSVVSASLLKTYNKQLGKLRTIELYNRLSESVKGTTYGVAIKRFIELNRDIKPGDLFTDIEQQNHLGIKSRLSDLKGKYILLEFWASWCGPCRRENPELVTLYKKMQPKGFEIFAVSVDESRQMWLRAIEKDQLPWTNVSELNGTKNIAVEIYGVYEYPTNFLIDPQGKIIAKNIRGKELEKILNEVLKK